MVSSAAATYPFYMVAEPVDAAFYFLRFAAVR